MTDIMIVKRRDKAHVIGLSDAGKHWLFTNIDGYQRVETIDVSVHADVADEFANILKAAGLEVEVK